MSNTAYGIVNIKVTVKTYIYNSSKNFFPKFELWIQIIEMVNILMFIIFYLFAYRFY